MATERLQKILSRAGFGSRRGCEAIISAGRVKINGEIGELGRKADPEVDQILVDDSPIALKQQLTYIKLYKPRGVLSSNKAQDDRKIIGDIIPIKGFLYSIGRLDYDSEGLMILTNDGDLTLRLTHPRYHHEKEYKVLVAGRPDDNNLKKWRRGLLIPDGYVTRPLSVNILKFDGTNTWLSVILCEGHKRQIREIGKATGFPVISIIRIRIGTITLGDLQPGGWRKLTKDEITNLRKAVKLDH